MADSWFLNDSAPSSLGDEFGPPAPEWLSADWLGGLGFVQPFLRASLHLATVVSAGAWTSASNALGVPNSVGAAGDPTIPSEGYWGFANSLPAGATPFGDVVFTVTFRGNDIVIPTFEVFQILQDGVAVSPAYEFGPVPFTFWQSAEVVVRASDLNGTLNNITVRVACFGDMGLDSVQLVASYTVSGAASYDGTVANAASATALSTPTGTQTHQGTVAPVTSATSTSTPTGTQTHEGAVAGASSTTELSTVAGGGAVVYDGAVAPANTATVLATPTGTQVHEGAVDPASSTTALTTVAGTQVHEGTVAAASSDTSLSLLAGTAIQQGAAAPGGSGDGARRIRTTQDKPRRPPVEVDDLDDEMFHFAAALISSGVLECL